MKNTKNTRVQKQQKKAKKQRQVSSLLMSGLVLSSVALPTVAVLADNAIQSQAPSTTQPSTAVPSTPASEAVNKVAQQPTEQTTQQDVKSTEQAKTSDVVNDESQFANGSTDFAPDDNPYANKAPEGGYLSDSNSTISTDKAVEGTATIHFIDKATGNKVKEDMEVKGSSLQDIRTVAGNDAFNVSGWAYNQEPNTFYAFKEGHTEYTAYFTSATATQRSEEKYVLGEDGYFRSVDPDGTINMYNRYADLTVTYTDAKTGEVLGVDTQEKTDANDTMYSDLTDYMINPQIDYNTWAMEKGASEWVDPDSAFQYGDKTYYQSLMMFTDPNYAPSGGHVVTPQNGAVNLTVPLTNMTETPEDQYVDFQVRWVDENGRDLATPSSEHLPIGATGEVVASDIEGYKLKDGEKESITYTVVEDMKDIVFHYVKDNSQYGVLQFKYLDAKTGKELKAPLSQVGFPDSAFVIDPDSEDFKISGYTLQKGFYEEEDTSTKIYEYPAKGTTKTIELKYDSDETDPVKQGSVTFKYVDKDSKELKAPKTVKGDVDSEFSEKAPTIKGYKLDTDKSDETVNGKFTEQGQTYYFVYNKDEATPEEDSKLRPVLESTISDAKPYVNKDKYQAVYVDKLDKAIKDGEQSLKDHPAPAKSAVSRFFSGLFDSKSTADLDKIFQANIDAIKTALEQVKEHPVVTPTEQGSVTFKYVDAGSHELQAPKTVKGDVGTAFSENAPTINGYKLDTDKSNQTQTGKFTSNAQTYYFVYNKDEAPAKQGSVTVSYVDESGKSIQGSKTLKGDVGSKFSEKAPTIKGYTLTSDSTLSGEFTEQAQSIKFTYKKDTTPTEKGTVQIHYIVYGMDEIKETKVLTGNVGDKFKETAPTIKGYKVNLSKSNVPEEGTFTKGTQHFYFMYEADNVDPQTKGYINFQLVDEQGKELKALYVTQNAVGNTIKVSDSDYFHIDGYKIKSGAKEYTYTAETQTVTVTYSKVEDTNNGEDNNSNQGGNTENNGGSTENGNNTTDNKGVTPSENGTTSPKADVKPLATATAKENKDTLPNTGESNNFWLFLSGLGVLLTTGLALIFKRKHN